MAKEPTVHEMVNGEFSREEKQVLYGAVKAQITAVSRSAGKQGIPLAKDAMLRHVYDLESLARKLEVWNG